MLHMSGGLEDGNLFSFLRWGVVGFVSFKIYGMQLYIYIQFCASGPAKSQDLDQSWPKEKSCERPQRDKAHQEWAPTVKNACTCLSCKWPHLQIRCDLAVVGSSFLLFNWWAFFAGHSALERGWVRGWKVGKPEVSYPPKKRTYTDVDEILTKI